MELRKAQAQVPSCFPEAELINLWFKYYITTARRNLYLFISRVFHMGFETAILSEELSKRSGWLQHQLLKSRSSPEGVPSFRNTHTSKSPVFHGTIDTRFKNLKGKLLNRILLYLILFSQVKYLNNKKWPPVVPYFIEIGPGGSWGIITTERQPTFFSFHREAFIL